MLRQRLRRARRRRVLQAVSALLNMCDSLLQLTNEIVLVGDDASLLRNGEPKPMTISAKSLLTTLSIAFRSSSISDSGAPSG